MPTITFTVPGRLRGKARPRFTVKNGLPRAYTPPKTRAEEGFIAILAKGAMSHLKPLEGPLRLEIIIVQNPPPSWSKAQRQAADWIITRPDLSNQIKSIEDGMMGIVYADDSQIASIRADRVWRTTGPERVEVKVSSLDERGLA